MKVLLKEDVDNLGYAGEIFEVSAGYGRNFLIPQGLAVPATPGSVKQAERWIEQAAARREQMRKEYQALVERINNTTITFEAKAGDKGRLYGSVTTADIAEKLQEELDIEVDRRTISVPGKALRQIGVHTATIRLDSDFVAELSVAVADEETGETTPAVSEVADEEADEAQEILNKRQTEDTEKDEVAEAAAETEAEPATA